AQPALAVQAIATARQAIAAAPASIGAYNVVAWANWSCHLYRWGPEPANALGSMAAAVEQMQRINALDHRTLTIAGVLRVAHGEPERGLGDLRRAVEGKANTSM